MPRPHLSGHHAWPADKLQGEKLGQPARFHEHVYIVPWLARKLALWREARLDWAACSFSCARFCGIRASPLAYVMVGGWAGLGSLLIFMSTSVAPGLASEPV